MEKIYVSGGVPLTGSVRISGSKNSSLAIMAGALLGEGPSILRNVPNIGDIHTMVEMLQAIGIGAAYTPDGTLTIDATELRACEAPYKLAQRNSTGKAARLPRKSDQLVHRIESSDTYRPLIWGYAKRGDVELDSIEWRAR